MPEGACGMTHGLRNSDSWLPAPTEWRACVAEPTSWARPDLCSPIAPRPQRASGPLQRLYGQLEECGFGRHAPAELSGPSGAAAARLAHLLPLALVPMRPQPQGCGLVQGSHTARTTQLFPGAAFRATCQRPGAMSEMALIASGPYHCAIPALVWHSGKDHWL
eukprot:365718-Chlamydomonas_euryale.AAC.28